MAWREGEACWPGLGRRLPHSLHRNKGPWGRPEVVWLRDAWVIGPRGADQGQPSEGLQAEGKQGGVASDAMVPTQDTARQEQYLMGGVSLSST